MKQILTLVLFVFAVASLSAQCVPDATFADSTGFVFPAPFTAERPDGGIQTPACINEQFDFTFTLKIPETLVYNGFDVNIEYIEVPTTGGVTGLPAGLGYTCDPPTCKFVPDGNLDCIKISGIVTDPALIGEHDLKIAAMFKADILAVPVSINLPDNSGIIAGADGNYTLTIKEEGTCSTTSTNDLEATDVSIRNSPNPFTTKTTIEVTSKVTDDFNLTVFDLLGNRVHQANIQIIEGSNTLAFDGSQLTNGMYIYSLSKGNTTFTNRMVIQR